MNKLAPTWDLSVLYKSKDDPNLSADLGELKKQAKEFSEKNKGKLSATLGDAIISYSNIEALSNKIFGYLSLSASTDVADAGVKTKLAEVERELGHIQGEYLTFFELEIAHMPEEQIRALAEQNEVVARHLPWLEHVRVFREHFLTEEVESALAKRGPFGPSAWSDFFDEAESDLRYDHNGEKNMAQMLHILTDSKDATEREGALRKINESFRSYFSKYSAQTLYVVTGRKAVEDKERGYTSPMTARNLDNRIPDESVDKLHEVVLKEGKELTGRYYRLKAKLLGLEKLKWSDRNAPIPITDTTEIPFPEAQTIVRSAYQHFSPTLADIVQRFYDEKRIDAPATHKKRQGAFNWSLVLPGNKAASFTFLNYLGSNRDVMTLAHELGHGVHGILAGEAQGPLMFHAPIAYCETASVFGERMTFDYLTARLRKAGDKQSLLAFLVGKIDDSMNTIIRQIGFSNFERRLHGMLDGYKEWQGFHKMSPEELSSIWHSTLFELYGTNGDIFTYENTDLLWSYIGHFHRPFYVYGYAFGELLTAALMAKRKDIPKFEQLYLDMLRSGSTKNVVELLAPFGLNPVSPEFWQDALQNALGDLISEAEELSK